MVHRPVVRSVTLVPVTVQTPVVAEVKTTASPDEAVAASVSGEAESEASASAAKLIVCAPWAMVPETVAPVALTGTPWLSVARIA